MEKNPHKQGKILVVAGPTSSGKSEMAVKLAKRFGGEIISADSRQVYRGLDIGSGKVPGKWYVRKTRGRVKSEQFIYKGVTHHGIDIASPKTQYSAGRFQKYARRAIARIQRQNKLPVLCGGTGHWTDAVIFNQNLPEVRPNLKLRKKLQLKSAADLYLMLKKLDPSRAKSIDAKNPRRLVRALEIIQATRRPVPKLLVRPAYSALWLGLKLPQKTLDAKIKKRLKQRLQQGLIAEVKGLHQSGLSWRRLENLGLEYKFCALYLQGKISKKQMFDLLFTAIRRYSQRQMTWFKRNKNIFWLQDTASALPLAKKFLDRE